MPRFAACGAAGPSCGWELWQHRHGSEVDAARSARPVERRSTGDRELKALIRAIVRDELAEGAAAKEAHLAGPTHPTGRALSARNARETEALNELDMDARRNATDSSPADSSEVMTADEVAAFLEAGVRGPAARRGAGEIAEFRATLVERKLGEKRINNIFAVLSKPMKYAVDVELTSKSRSA